MNRLVIIGVTAMALAAYGQVRAQESGQQADMEIEEGRAMVRAGHDEIVRMELALTGEQAELFDPVYVAYKADIKAVMDRYTVMVIDYVERYDRGDLSDEYAEELMETFFDIKQELLDIKRGYLPRFKSILPALKVAQFYQVENKIEAEIDAQLAMAVPLVDPT